MKNFLSLLIAVGWTLGFVYAEQPQDMSKYQSPPLINWEIMGRYKTTPPPRRRSDQQMRVIRELNPQMDALSHSDQEFEPLPLLENVRFKRQFNYYYPVYKPPPQPQTWTF